MKKLIFILVMTPLFVTLLSFNKGGKFDLEASVTRGKQTYTMYCQSCHMDQGQGLNKIYPPLAKSDYLMADKNRSILQVIEGAKGEMIVNGKKYSTPMAAIKLTDEQTSDVLNYVRNSFGNKGGAIKPEEVKKLRNK
ncbi:MAG: cytochrome c [Bacteroidetes bacterium]|nr:cytochrome c [Bacteroidota bacterium]